MTDTTKKPSAAEVAIAAIREYFEDRQDASMEPGEDRFHGNKEMALLEEVATVEAALTRLSEAEKDRARLDWLQLHSEDLDITRDLRPGSETIYVDCSVTGTLGHGKGLRAAIDAAMEAK